MFSALAAPRGLIASALLSTANLCQPAPQIAVSCASRQAHRRSTHPLLRDVAEDPFRPRFQLITLPLQRGENNRIVRRTYDGGEQLHELVMRRRNCAFCRSLGNSRKRCCVIEHSSPTFPSFESATGRLPGPRSRAPVVTPAVDSGTKRSFGSHCLRINLRPEAISDQPEDNSQSHGCYRKQR